MISIERLRYRYPDAGVETLSGITLEVQPGGLTLLIGETGSGKSTLLKSMNGLVPHFYGGEFGGRVSVDGIDTLSCRPRDLAGRVGFVGQDPEDHAVSEIVEDDVAFTLENLGIDHSTMRKRVEEVLDALGIAKLRDRKLDTLSGGERQRAAIASVLAAMPSHLVLDEPTSQLDPQSAEEVISAMLRLRDELGLSVVLAEHRLERVLQYAQHLWSLNGGVQSGTPAEVLQNIESGPPIVKFGRALGWRPLPLNLREARTFLPALTVRPRQPEAPRSPGDYLIRARGAGVVLGGARVLGDVSLEISEGEVVALMGRNGSGKTTLLRALAGLIRKHSGSIDVRGAVALVPQNPETILVRSSVADEIEATLKGRRRPHGRADIEREAERFGVSHLLTRYPRDLSGGEKTRTALAAASAGDPPIMLLDEPTRGLDEPGKAGLEDLIQGWSAEGRCVVIATHDVELAARSAHRIVMLSGGEIVIDGPARSALGSSLTFSTQMNKVFRDPRILTLDDALAAVNVT